MSQSEDTEDVKLFIVSTKGETEADPENIDPLEEEIGGLKMTLNLIKEITFNNTMNKFDLFEQLLEK